MTFLHSSIGKKLALAVSGALLFGFLLTHVAGNALLLTGDGGAAYDDYAQGLKDLGPLLWVARIGLASLFAVHIGLALRVSAENRRARGGRYVGTSEPRRRTFASSTMLWTGIAIAAFLVVHLEHFSFDARFDEDGAALVRETLSRGDVAAIYAVALVALALHLAHALPSALQTFGLGRARWATLVRSSARYAGPLVALGFAVILVATYVA